jgi:hypothetical protein
LEFHYTDQLAFKFLGLPDTWQVAHEIAAYMGAVLCAGRTIDSIDETESGDLVQLRAQIKALREAGELR